MTQSTRPTSEVLSSLALFADLTRPQLDEVEHLFEEQFFKEGDRILRQGFQGTGFYVIIEGEAAFILDGKEGGQLVRGDFFGEVSALLGEPPMSDVVARTELRCLVLGGPALRDFLESHPKVMYRMLQVEAARLRDSVV